MSTQPVGSTPPISITEPVPSRYEYQMGYHSAVVERLPDGVLWSVAIVSPLITQLETVIYDDEELAKEGAKTYLKGVYDGEQIVRQKFYAAYLPAYGRGSAPDAHGPQYVDPNAPAEEPAPTEPAPV